jgi:hypothetical protein
MIKKGAYLWSGQGPGKEEGIEYGIMWLKSCKDLFEKFYGMNVLFVSFYVASS